MRTYANEMAQSTLQVTLVDPGPMATELFIALAEASCTENGALIAL